MRIPYSKDREISCPYCENKTLEAISTTIEPAEVDPRHSFIIRQCSYCKRFSFVDVLYCRAKSGDSYTIITHKYPSRKQTELENAAIPKKVKADYLEGLKDLENGCFKSACVMFRRSIQSAAIELGANKRSKLEKQIDLLEKKRIITPELKELAHTLRVVGNKGAHPLKEDFDELTTEDALEMSSFLKEFINYAFILRKRLQDRKKNNLKDTSSVNKQQ